MPSRSVLELKTEPLAPGLGVQQLQICETTITQLGREQILVLAVADSQVIWMDQHTAAPAAYSCNTPMHPLAWAMIPLSTRSRAL